MIHDADDLVVSSVCFYSSPLMKWMTILSNFLIVGLECTSSGKWGHVHRLAYSTISALTKIIA
jgi:hypothetical protein